MGRVLQIEKKRDGLRRAGRSWEGLGRKAEMTSEDLRLVKN